MGHCFQVLKYSHQHLQILVSLSANLFKTQVKSEEESKKKKKKDMSSKLNASLVFTKKYEIYTEQNPSNLHTEPTYSCFI